MTSGAAFEPPDEAASMARGATGAVREVSAETTALISRVRGMAGSFDADRNGWDVETALDAAAVVEDLARTVSHLQLVAAHAVATSHERPAADPGACRLDGNDGAPLSFGASAHLSLVRPSDDATGAAGPARETPARRQRSPYRRAADGLRVRLRLSQAEARRRVVTARDVLGSRTMSGVPLAPEFPLVGELLADGAGDRDAVRHILHGMHDIGRAVRHRHRTDVHRASADADQPGNDGSSEALARREQADATAAEEVTEAERILTTAAREVDADSVRRLVDRVVHLVDQDGAPPSEAELSALQGVFWMGRRHGLHQVRLCVDDVGREMLETIFATATNPRTYANHGCDNTTDADPGAERGAVVPTPGSASAADVTPVERRPVARLRLDALLAACGAALRARALPDTGGLPTQVMVTIALNDLRAGIGSAELPYTGPVPARDARRLACDADVIPIVLGSAGQILDVGRSKRLFPAHHRKALTARDGGCAFPGCHIPAPWCEGHHVTPWWKGGTTRIDHATLLCAYHHHLIHAGRWTVQMRNGTPHFYGPGQATNGPGMRNTYHRLAVPRRRRQ